MKTHIGLVGPHDAVSSVTEVAQEFSDRIHILPFLYNNFEELSEIVQTNSDLADIWVFTGITAFQMATNSSFAKGKLLIQSGGSALMKQLFQISQDRLRPERVSIDTLPERDCRETFLEMGLPVEHLHTLSAQELMLPLPEYTAFHLALYENKQVDACITHHISVYRELQKRGVPVYRLLPTRMSIRQALHLACQQGETNYFRKSQIAVAIISIQESAESESNYYVAYQQKLKVEEYILRYAEKVSGTLVPLSNRKFMITTARGAVEQSEEHPPYALLAQIRLLTDSDVSCGIGYGINGRGAEQNASLALYHAERSAEAGGAVIVDERGNVIGSLANNEPFSFNYRTEDAELIERLKREGIAASTYNKLVSMQRSLGNALSASTIAEWLNMSYRNANRILLALERSGLVQVVGQETPTTVGRPRKLYRITNVDGVQ